MQLRYLPLDQSVCILYVCDVKIINQLRGFVFGFSSMRAQHFFDIETMNAQTLGGCLVL